VTTQAAVCGCPCAQCADGVHIFCNKFPHGSVDEAVAWFEAHPEVARSVRPLGGMGQIAVDRALERIEAHERVRECAGGPPRHGPPPGVACDDKERGE